MDFSGFIDRLSSFAQANTVIAIMLALCLLYFMYRKTKVFFSLLVLGLILAGLFNMITDMAGSSSAQKKKLIFEEEKQFDNTR